MTKHYTLDEAVRDICAVPTTKSKTREIIKRWHAQEVERVRGEIEKIPRKQEISNQPGRSIMILKRNVGYNQALDDVLLAITDEK